MNEPGRTELIPPSTTLLADLAEDGYDGAESTRECEIREAVVPIPCHGHRLDRTLALIVPEFSRSYLQQLIETGFVKLKDQTVKKTSSKVKAGDLLQIELRPTPQSQAFKSEPMSLNLIFEDEHLVVIDKPAGLVVHPWRRSRRRWDQHPGHGGRPDRRRCGGADAHLDRCCGA